MDGDRQITVHGQQVSEIGTSYTLTVGETQVSNTKIAHILGAGEEIQINGGVRIVIKAGIGGICLQSAESAISIDATGITLQGPIRFGKATCLPPMPEPIAPIIKPVTSPKWPGDDPGRIS